MKFSIPVLFTFATTALGQFDFGGFGGGGFGGGGWDMGGQGGGFGGFGGQGGFDMGGFGGNTGGGFDMGGFGGNTGGGFDMGGFGGNTGATTGGATLGGGAPATGDTVKIMPVGDSITFGMGENGGYRKYLYQALTQKGYKIDMVGPEGSASASANGISYDDNHAGYSGYQIKEIPDWGRQQGNEGSLYNKLKSKNAVKQAQPDIILLIIGTNDMTANRNLDACASDLRDLVDYMLQDMPAGGVIFMGSIPEFTAYGGNPQRVGNYNQTVKKVADEYKSKGKNVIFADTHGSLSGSDIGSDQLHPNGNGYKKIGNYWAQVIDEYLQSKNASNTQTQTQTQTQQPQTQQPQTQIQPQQGNTQTQNNLSKCSSRIVAQGYKCCLANCVVYYSDADGDWGVENNQWCGCGNSNTGSCVGAQGYPCCKSTRAVVYVDGDGNWGVENGDWCIIKN